MTDNIPKICAAFEMWQNNDCIKPGTTLELIMRYLADDPEIDVVVSSADQDRAYRDYIGRQNESLNAKTMIIRDLNKNRTDVLSVSRTMIDNLEAELKTAKSDYEIMRTNCGNTIAKLQDDIKGLKEFGTKPPTTELPTNEECIGCCRVVDISANLQKELDDCQDLNESLEAENAVLTRSLNNVDKSRTEWVQICFDGRREVEELKQTIEELKDRNIEDLHELYDLYEKELRGLKADRTSIKSDRDIMFQNNRNTVAKLREDIRGLEVELSTCVEDSEVLMEAVEIIKNWDDTTGRAFPTLYELVDLLTDYLDAPEGPPETPIDDLYTTTISVMLEMP